MGIILDIADISVRQGLTLALVTLGVCLSFRVLDFPDLTVDGSFMVGAATCATLIMHGTAPWIATCCAMPIGLVAGALTGLLHTKLRVSKLLAGILMMTMLYSIGLRIMGRANIPLLNYPTILRGPDGSLHSHMWTAGLFATMVLTIALALAALLHTRLGVALRATGDNPRMAEGVGINTDHMKVLGVAMGNGVVALGGAIVAQHQGFADVGMGLGTIIVALAAIVIGEAFVRPKSIELALAAAVVGAILYEAVIAVGLRLGLAPTDLKLATGLIIVAALVLRLSGQDEADSIVPQRY